MKRRRAKAFGPRVGLLRDGHAADRINGADRTTRRHVHRIMVGVGDRHGTRHFRFWQAIITSRPLRVRPSAAGGSSPKMWRKRALRRCPLAPCRLNGSSCRARSCQSRRKALKRGRGFAPVALSTRLGLSHASRAMTSGGSALPGVGGALVFVLVAAAFGSGFRARSWMSSIRPAFLAAFCCLLLPRPALPTRGTRLQTSAAAVFAIVGLQPRARLAMADTAPTMAAARSRQVWRWGGDMVVSEFGRHAPNPAPLAPPSQTAARRTNNHIRDWKSGFRLARRWSCSARAPFDPVLLGHGGRYQSRGLSCPVAGLYRPPYQCGGRGGRRRRAARPWTPPPAAFWPCRKCARTDSFHTWT